VTGAGVVRVSRSELVRSLAAVIEAPGPHLAPVVDALGLSRLPSAAEHTDTFSFQLYPYASVHLGPEGQLGGVARDRVAGFLRALEVTPPAEPDHLVVLLGAYAQLIDLDTSGDGGRAHHARTVLLHEHLWSWVPRWLDRVVELAPEPYREWAVLLDRTLTAELEEVGRPTALPAHLREAPPLPDPRDGDAGAFLAGVLAPVRSGLVLARADLSRAAAELDLGLRVGERAYALRALLAQDAGGVLRHLAGEARRQRDRLTQPDLIGDAWRSRLERTADLLEELQEADADAIAGA
jgi:hypothetical protein